MRDHDVISRVDPYVVFAMMFAYRLIAGFGFGQEALVAPLLAEIVSGYIMGIMMSNAGGA